MEDIFTNVTGGSLTGNDYLEWREIYDPLSVTFTYHDTDEENNAAIERYWDEFLRAYYLTTHDSGYVPRAQFHTDTGIPDSQIDWDLWRSIKRGTP
jgi:hypothetical protein